MSVEDEDAEPSSAEIGLILAALRFYQRGLRRGEIPQDILDIASDGGTTVPLTYVEIDDVCERVNR